jgi:hypothetical protein
VLPGGIRSYIVTSEGLENLFHHPRVIDPWWWQNSRTRPGFPVGAVFRFCKLRHAPPRDKADGPIVVSPRVTDVVSEVLGSRC